MNDSLYRPALKAPKHTSYAVREVIPDEWATIPANLKDAYEELWLAMRPARLTDSQVDITAFAAACQRAGLWGGWPTVPLLMDELCKHWCRYCAMEEARLGVEP